MPPFLFKHPWPCRIVWRNGDRFFQDSLDAFCDGLHNRARTTLLVRAAAEWQQSLPGNGRYIDPIILSRGQALRISQLSPRGDVSLRDKLFQDHCSLKYPAAPVAP